MILVDTHVVLWLSMAPDKISTRAAAAIRRAREGAEGVAVSSITLLEFTLLAGRNRIRLNSGLESYLQDIESRFTALPITSRICAAVLSLPATFPKDPADRVITATALSEGLLLVTADEQIRDSKVVATIW